MAKRLASFGSATVLALTALSCGKSTPTESSTPPPATLAVNLDLAYQSPCHLSAVRIGVDSQRKQFDLLGSSQLNGTVSATFMVAPGHHTYGFEYTVATPPGYTFAGGPGSFDAQAGGPIDVHLNVNLNSGACEIHGSPGPPGDIVSFFR